MQNTISIQKGSLGQLVLALRGEAYKLHMLAPGVAH